MKAVTLDVPYGDPNFGKAFPCPSCQGPKLAQAKLDRMVADSGLSPHHMLTFDDFWGLPPEYREGKEEAASLCAALAQEGQVLVDGLVKYGLLLHGIYGVGKTTLATSTLIERARMGYPVLRVKHADFIDKVQRAYSASENQPDSDEILSAACKAPFAMIDDLGDPMSTKLITDDKRRIIHRLLEYRLEYNLPTVITTNLTQEQIRQQFSERTAQRIFELTHWVVVTGQNLRQ